MHVSDPQAAIVAKRAERRFVTDPVELCVLLTEELGELARRLERRWSPNHPAPEKAEYAKGVRDVAVTLAALAHELGVDLEDAILDEFFAGHDAPTSASGPPPARPAEGARPEVP